MNKKEVEERLKFREERLELIRERQRELIRQGKIKTPRTHGRDLDDLEEAEISEKVLDVFDNSCDNHQEEPDFHDYDCEGEGIKRGYKNLTEF